jgi:hypothetical protein
VPGRTAAPRPSVHVAKLSAVAVSATDGAGSSNSQAVIREVYAAARARRGSAQAREGWTQVGGGLSLFF